MNPVLVAAVLAIAIYIFVKVTQVRIKDGVILNVSHEISYAIGVADSVYISVAGFSVTVTSARDQHQNRPESLHNIGQAVDFRIRDLNVAQQREIWTRLRNLLFPQGFDVVLESDHIHVEYDPKVAQGRVFTGEVVT